MVGRVVRVPSQALEHAGDKWPAARQGRRPRFSKQVYLLCIIAEKPNIQGFLRLFRFQRLGRLSLGQVAKPRLSLW